MPGMQKQLVVCAAALLCAFQWAPADATPLATTYLNEAGLVFQPAALRTGELPSSILVPGLRLTFASDIQRVCRRVHAGHDDLLVFMPESMSCLSLTALFAQAREAHPESAFYGVLERDRQLMVKGLESDVFLVMQPKTVFASGPFSDGAAAFGACSCPNPPEVILIDGFEDAP